MNKAKRQGTAWETAIKKRLWNSGYAGAVRIAEGGPNDEGDVEFYDTFGQHWIVECKARANYNSTQGLAKAKRKAPKNSIAVVAWKKLTRKEGNEKRTSDGEPDIVIMDWDTYMLLVGGQFETA